MSPDGVVVFVDVSLPVSISENATNVHLLHRDHIHGQSHLGFAASHRHQYTPGSAHLAEAVQRLTGYVVPVISVIMYVYESIYTYTIIYDTT